MATSKPTHVVVHKSLYLMVGGKLQEMAVGTHLTLSREAAQKMVKKGFIMSVADAKTVEVGGAKSSDGDDK